MQIFASRLAVFTTNPNTGRRLRVFNPLITSPGHFSDLTFFVTPAVTRFSILLSVIYKRQSICLSPDDTSFVPFIALFGKAATAPTRKLAFYSKNCSLPFLTDRSGSNAQSFIFYNYNLTNRLSNIVTAPQLHVKEEQ